jgi:hypothetical protein
VTTAFQFETSASYMAAVTKALKKLGKYDAVLAKVMAPKSKQSLEDSYAQRWWGTQESIDLTLAVAAVGGPELVRQVGRLAVVESISAIVRPLLSVLIAVSGASPAAILSRYQDFTITAVRNIQTAYEPKSTSSGVLTVTYPCQIPKEYIEFWLGGIGYIFDVTKKTKGPSAAHHHGSRMVFELSWL